MTTPAQSALLLALGASGALLSLAFLAPRLPRRRNFAGREIPTAAGSVFLPIILVTLVLGTVGTLRPGGVGLAYLVFALVAGVVGFADDVWGGAEARGFRGHFGALAGGRVTTGLSKLVVLGGGALVFALVVVDGVLHAIFAAVLMAGSTNLANLFDVRPGRAIKFVGLLLLPALPFASSPALLVALPVAGGAVALFPFDVRARIMLGDAGAAVLGATLGYVVVVGGPGPSWWFSLAVILGLTALAEVSSISKVIERVGFLRRFDSWGRN